MRNTLSNNQNLDNNLYTSEEQIIYANIVRIFVIIGLIFLFCSFIIYISGLLDSQLRPSDSAAGWHLSADEYAEATGGETGFRRLLEIPDAAALSFSSLIFFAMTTILCFIPLIFVYAKKKDFIYAFIVAVQILILVFAASGISQVH